MRSRTLSQHQRTQRVADSLPTTANGPLIETVAARVPPHFVELSDDWAPTKSSTTRMGLSSVHARKTRNRIPNLHHGKPRSDGRDGECNRSFGCLRGPFDPLSRGRPPSDRSIGHSPRWINAPFSALNQTLPRHVEWRDLFPRTANVCHYGRLLLTSGAGTGTA
jgi:hypothetical protein